MKYRISWIERHEMTTQADSEEEAKALVLCDNQNAEDLRVKLDDSVGFPQLLLDGDYHGIVTEIIIRPSLINDRPIAHVTILLDNGHVIRHCIIVDGAQGANVAATFGIEAPEQLQNVRVIASVLFETYDNYVCNRVSKILPERSN